jgi:hypothetical protein
VARVVVVVTAVVTEAAMRTADPVGARAKAAVRVTATATVAMRAT